MMWRPRLPSPFGATFLGVPTAFQLILHDLGFAPVQSDGEILVACCLEWVKKDKVANPDAVVFDPRPWTRIVGLAPDGNHVLVASDTYNLILARILGSQPQPLEEADLELATKTLDREEWILSGSIEAPDVLAVANKWRHWKPGKIKTQLPTSQRALEQHLRARWLERLLGYFIPFRHQIPYMHQVMGARELEEFGHLFGDARFRTIRAHCLAYEGMRKIGFQNLPWTAGDVRATGSRSPRRMSIPGRSDTWCAPSGTRFSRSSRPCNSTQEGRSESTSDMRTGRTRWRPCSRKSRTHRPRMPAPRRQAGHHQGGCG